VPGRKRKEIKGAQPSPNKKKGRIYNNGDLFQTCHQSRESETSDGQPSGFFKTFPVCCFFKKNKHWR
jgi:hypothetical protein